MWLHSFNISPSNIIDNAACNLHNVKNAKIFALFFTWMFNPKSADQFFKNLLQEIPWVQNKISFYGKQSLVPRLESWHGDKGMSYKYSGINMDAKPWTKNLLKIKQSIEPFSPNLENTVVDLYP